MNTTNIPRYKASMPLQKQFITSADKTGDQVFTQLERNGDCAVYRRNTMDGKVFGYEIMKIKTVKAGTVFGKGATPIENDYESYPGAESFGKSAWFLPTEESAFKKLDEILLEK